MTVPVRCRDHSIDRLRGLAIVLMVLDHTRAMYFGRSPRPTDLSVTTPILFMTRWITHPCAPIFLLLAGYAVWLYQAKHGLRATRSFLIKRGIWLIVLELTVIRLAWIPEPFYRLTVLQVIWVIGLAFLFLVPLLRGSPRVVLLLGLGMLLTHNLLDPIAAEDLGAYGWLWRICHEQGQFSLTDNHAIAIVYPAIPWIGVCLLGYGLADVLQRLSWDARRRSLRRLGGLGILGFLLVRSLNGYGNAHPWIVAGSQPMTVVSFLNCEKYPPSLAFLLMTLGPALVLWTALGRESDRRERGVTIRLRDIYAEFGRVPLFAYVLHLYILRLSSFAFAYAFKGNAVFSASTSDALSPTMDLGTAYLVWLLTIGLMLPLVRWFANVKRRHRHWWISYL